MDKLLTAIEYGESYSLSDLFKIRDALIVLKNYDLHDEFLLRETELFIKDMEGKK